MSAESDLKDTLIRRKREMVALCTRLVREDFHGGDDMIS